MSKYKAQRMHFAERSASRVGELDKQAQREILKGIKAGGNSLVSFYDRQSLRVTRWRVELADGVFLVVYDKDRKNLVTIYEIVEGLENF